MNDDSHDEPLAEPSSIAAPVAGTVLLSEATPAEVPRTMLLGDAFDVGEPLERTVRLGVDAGASLGPAIATTVALQEHAEPLGTSVLPFDQAISPWAALPIPPTTQESPAASTGTITLSPLEQLDAARPQLPFIQDRPPAPRPSIAAAEPSPHARPIEAEPGAAPSLGPIAPPAWIGATPPKTVEASSAHIATDPLAGIALEHPPSLAVALRVAPSSSGIVLTLIAKLTCDLVVRGAARPRPEADPLSRDVHVDGDARRSLLYASDYGEEKLRTDVTLVGSAIAATPGARSGEVSFEIGHEGQGFERRIAVFGDRRWLRRGRLAAISTPEPFDRIPLVYERAFGGAAYAWNPIGIGFDATLAENGSALPNLEDPDHLVRNLASEPRPACFAPIPPAWQERPQIAPRAQQLSNLRGDEPFTIAGTRPGGAIIEGRLPGLWVRAQAYKAPPSNAEMHEISVLLATVGFDTDAMKLNLVFRGTLEIPGDETTSLGIASVVVTTVPLEP